MTVPNCPDCRQIIPADEINVAKDLAYCRSCNAAHSLSGLIESSHDLGPKLDLERPPSGAWYRRDPLAGVIIGATHRTWGAAAGYLAIALLGNGIVSVFVLIALSGTLRHLGVVLPGWFPAPKMDGEDIGVGELIFLWIFLTPFIVVGTGMILGFLSSIIGRTEVRVLGTTGRAFVGVGPLGWSRRFPISAVKAVVVSSKDWRDSEGAVQNKTQIEVQLSDGESVKFGSMLSDSRQRFLAGALRKDLL